MKALFKTAALAVLASLFLFSSNLFAQSADVYILAGQSNMMGHGTSEGQLPSGLQGQQNDLFITGLSIGTPNWKKMDAPNTGKYGNSLENKGFGPEITFARRVANKTGKRVYVLKWALGGQNLHNDFLGNGGKGSDALYPYLSREKSKIEQALKDQYGLTANYKAFLWMQGESDATADLSPKYKANLESLISKVRGDFGSNLPVIVGRISDWQNTNDWNRVRDAQVNVAKNTSKVYWINTDDLATYPNDGVHYNAQGLQDLGYRFADKYIDKVVGSSNDGGSSASIISGVHRLEDAHKNRYLHADGKYDWAVVKSAPLNKNWDSQRWRFEHVKNDVYRLKNVWTQTYLSSGSQNSWDNLYVAPLNKGWTSQQWNVQKVGSSNQYRLRNVWSGQYIHTQADVWSDILQAPLNKDWSAQKYRLK